MHLTKLYQRCLMKIIDYKILTHYRESTLEILVKTDIDEGWQPFHGVYIDNIAGEKYCSQAMVKYQENKKSELPDNNRKTIEIPGDNRYVLIQIDEKTTGIRTWHIGNREADGWHIPLAPEWKKYANFVTWAELPQD